MLDGDKNKIQTEEEKEFDYCCKLYKEKFGKRAYIAMPGGTRKQTIDAIKVCLEKMKIYQINYYILILKKI